MRIVTKALAGTSMAGPNRAVASVGPGGGGPAPPDKVLAPLVGPGRYIQSVQNNKFSNKNRLVHLKNSLAAPEF